MQTLTQPAVVALRALQVAGAVSLAIATAYVAAARPTSAIALAGALFATIAFAAAFARPALVVGLGFAALAAIPMTSAPARSVLILHPGLVLLWAAVGALVVKNVLAGARARLTLVDGLAIALSVVLVLPVAAGVRAPVELGRLLFLWAGPYLVARLLVSRYGVHALLRTVVLAALALVPFAVFEAATGTNVFLSLPKSTSAAPEFLQSVARLGGQRAQASFGHPIALAMLFATASLLAAGLAATQRGRARIAWMLAAGVLAAAQITTLSRTGWVIVVLGVLLVVVTAPRVLRRPARVVGGVAVVAALVALVAVGPARALILPSAVEPAGGEVQRSGAYRTALIQFAIRPGTLKPLGQTQLPRGPQGNRSIDNQYIYFGILWGVVPLAPFILLPFAVLLALRRVRRDVLSVVVLAAVVGNFAALTGVALFTQQQLYFWLLVGAASGIVATARQRTAAPLVPPREPLPSFRNA